MDEFRLTFNREVVFGAGQPLQKHRLAFPELVDPFSGIAQEDEQDAAVLPFQGVDHVFGGKDAPVVFAQDCVGCLAKGYQIHNGPRNHQAHEGKGDAISSQYFLFQCHETQSSIRSL